MLSPPLGIFLLLLTAAATVQNARDSVPELYAKSPHSLSTFLSTFSTITPLESPGPVFSLSTPWIKEFLAFQSHTVHAQSIKLAALQPLRSTIINYGATLADENDLRAWTRHLVDTLREDNKSRPHGKVAEPKEVELDVDQFIEYLITHKNFRPEDLNFLRRPELDHGYEEIEDELDKIKRNQKKPKTIVIGGEKPNCGSGLVLSWLTITANLAFAFIF